MVELLLMAWSAFCIGLPAGLLVARARGSQVSASQLLEELKEVIASNGQLRGDLANTQVELRGAQRDAAEWRAKAEQYDTALRFVGIDSAGFPGPGEAYWFKKSFEFITADVCVREPSQDELEAMGEKTAVLVLATARRFVIRPPVADVTLPGLR